MRKKIRKILHLILKIEISVLFFILYYVVIVPMAFFQKISNFLKGKSVTKTNWNDFSEKYQTIEDLGGEG